MSNFKGRCRFPSVKQPKLSRSGTPIPLDSQGNEMCLLFLKYGRCRYKKKCTKSHWVPPLPAEDFPVPPPLPPFPPPSSFENNLPTKTTVGSSHLAIDASEGEVWRNTSEISFELTNIYNYRHEQSAAKKDVNICSVGEGNKLHAGCGQASHQEEIKINENVDYITTLPSQAVTRSIQSDNNPFTEKLSTLPTPQVLNTDMFSSTSKEGTMRTVQNRYLCSSAKLDDNKLVVSCMEEIVDEVVQKIGRGRSRFDHVYIQETRDQGTEGSCRYKSSIDQVYERHEAYFNNWTKKLEVKNKPQNKTEKRNLKFMRRAHWNACQALRLRLAYLPPGYSLKVQLAAVNFVRLRPYFCLLIHQCFYTAPACVQWRPTPFSCLVADTIIAFLRNQHITPLDAEKKLQEWGGRPVRVRQCVCHLWSIIVKSSLSITGVAKDVLACEKEVFSRKPSSVDYAYACYLARSVTRRKKKLSDFMPLAVSKSVRQGIQSSKKSLIQKQKTVKHLEINMTVDTNTSCIQSSEVKTGDDVGLTKKKLSFLNKHDKDLLMKRCKTILEKVQ